MSLGRTVTIPIRTWYLAGDPVPLAVFGIGGDPFQAKPATEAVPCSMKQWKLTCGHRPEWMPLLKELPVTPRNALFRGGIHTMSQLRYAVEHGRLQKVARIGPTWENRILRAFAQQERPYDHS